MKLLSSMNQVCPKNIEVVDSLSMVTTMFQLQYEAMRTQRLHTVQHKVMRTSRVSMIQYKAMRVGDYNFGECYYL